MNSPQSEPRTLHGQSALVTGGGSGIGLAIARRIGLDGSHVVIAGRNEQRLASAIESLAHHGIAATAVQCDVTKEGEVEHSVEIARSVGDLTMCVANAGFGSAAPLHLTTLESWNGILSTNLTGAFLTLKHATTAMAARGGGAIVAVSSIAGHLTHRFMTPYAVSKAGLEMLVKQVADELGPSGIRANCVRPGLVPTDATTGVLQSEPILHDYLEQMPLGRVGTESDVAELVRFLLGPESGWITGQCIGVDGGHAVRRGPNLTPAMQAVLGDALTPPGPAQSNPPHQN